MTTEHVSVPREVYENLAQISEGNMSKHDMQDLASEAYNILSRATPSDVRCTTCDGTGDVHRADGEWLGECTACDAKKTSAPRVVTNSEPSGTFECPVCGFDKPHHHGENDRFPWHMKYRTTFEDIVRKHIRAVGGGVMRQYVYGHSGAITIRPGQYLAYDGRRARDTAKQHDQTGTEWSAFSKSSPFNGGYEHEWLDDLWNIFKQTVAALESFATSLPAARVPDGWKLVPLVPTAEMEDAAFDTFEIDDAKTQGFNSGTDARNAIYKAMLDAAPQAGEES